MDKVIDKSLEIKEELLSLEEIKEYLRLKTLLESDEELKQLRLNIAELTSLDKKEEKDNLLNIYNSHPLVENFEASKKEVLEILRTIKDIID